MQLRKYIPDFEDCIDIPLTKHTWVWIQNNTYTDWQDEEEIEVKKAKKTSLKRQQNKHS